MSRRAPAHFRRGELPPGNGTEGSALVIVLTLLSIALMVGVGFSFFLNTTRNAVETDLYKSRARFAAEAGLLEAIAIIQSQYDPSDGNQDIHDLFPATSPGKDFHSPATGVFAGRSYLCSASDDNGDIDEAFHLRMDGKTFVANAIMDVSDPAAPTGDNRGFTIVVSDSRVVARYAFMAIDESGKINPNTATMAGSSEATAAVTRIGASDSEISLQDAGLADYDNYTPAAGQYWSSMRQIARQLSPTDFEDKVIKILHPANREPTPETYWSDIDNDDSIDADEILPRMRFAGDDAALANYYKAFIAPDDPDSALPNIGDLNDDNDCRWIKDLADEGVAANGGERRRIAAQIAVNIRDYVDADSIPTVAWVNTAGELTLVDPGAGGSEMRIVGREQHYGLSELAVKLEVRITGSPPFEDLKLDVFLKAEMYYPDKINEPLGAYTLSGTFSATVTTVLGGSKIYFNKAPFSIVPTEYNNEEGGTVRFRSSWTSAGSHTEVDTMPDASAPYTISNFQIDSVVINDGTMNVDVFPAQPASSYFSSWLSASNLSGDNDLFASVEAYDPLNNDVDQQTPPAGSLWRSRPAGGTAMYENDESNIGIGELTRKDLAPGVGPPAILEYGDVVVRNGPPERVGELGRIGGYNRGRSLRLWAANDSDEQGSDGKLLDMFTVDDGSLGTRGRININTMNSDVLTALFTNAATVPVAAVVNAILAKRVSPMTFSSIGDVFAIAGVSGSDSAADDVEEAMVEKIAELITVRSNYFSIVVSAYAVKDIGGQVFYVDLNGDGDTYDFGEAVWTKQGEYEHHGDYLQGHCQLLAVVYRDAFTNDCSIEYMEFVK